MTHTTTVQHTRAVFLYPPNDQQRIVGRATTDTQIPICLTVNVPPNKTQGKRRNSSMHRSTNQRSDSFMEKFLYSSQRKTHFHQPPPRLWPFLLPLLTRISATGVLCHYLAPHNLIDVGYRRKIGFET
ncbi:hypothetical protein Pelo_17640 [Pelomyxa schiedti]|nr:hypothetical protein Pelo_17640 [Pelomyxa schiedti]